MEFRKTIALGLAAFAAFLPLGTQAEDLINPAVQDALIADITSACSSFVAHRAGAVEGLVASGWEMDEATETYNLTDVFGERGYEGVGSVELYMMIEHYPAHQLSYCGANVMYGDVVFDIERIGTTGNLAGELQTTGDNVYGAWSGTQGSALQLVQAYQDGSDFHYQITEIQSSAE